MSKLDLIKPAVSISLIDKVEQYKLLKGEIDRLNRLLTQVKSEIVVKMGDNTEIYNTEGSIIGTYREKNRTSVDSKRLEELYNDAYVDCLKITTYKELRIK